MMFATKTVECYVGIGENLEFIFWFKNLGMLDLQAKPRIR